MNEDRTHVDRVIKGWLIEADYMFAQIKLRYETFYEFATAKTARDKIGYLDHRSKDTQKDIQKSIVHHGCILYHLKKDSQSTPLIEEMEKNILFLAYLIGEIRNKVSEIRDLSYEEEE